MKTLHQETPPCLGNIQFRAGSFAICSEAESYTARATQGRKVPTEEPDETCSATMGHGGPVLSATLTHPGPGADHRHARTNNMDSETKWRHWLKYKDCTPKKKNKKKKKKKTIKTRHTI
jgi:hypothetical protein